MVVANGLLRQSWVWGRRRSCHRLGWGKGRTGGGNSMCKGSEVEMNLAHGSSGWS